MGTPPLAPESSVFLMTFFLTEQIVALTRALKIFYLDRIPSFATPEARAQLRGKKTMRQ
jgi:hypothetical protein